MIKKLKNLGRDELVRGSIILFIMINIFNLLNYVFQFSMARMLGPADYGILAVLMSLIYIFTISAETIQTTISKYTSKFNVREQVGKIKDIIYRGVKKGFKMSLLIFILFLPVAFFLSNFLKIDVWLFIITGSLLLFYFSLVFILRGVLQGRKKFSLLGFNMVFEGIIKLVVAISLVLIGWGVYGAVASFVIAGFIALIICFIFIKDVLKSKRERADIGGVYGYSFLMLVAITAIVLMYSLDVIIARRFFPEELVGKYAVVAFLGRAIYFGTFAISKAMFSLTSEGFENGRKTGNLLKKSLKITGLISVAVLLIYLFFPKWIITIFFGEQYIEGFRILFFVGLALTFLSFTNLIVLYGFSIDKIKKSAWFLFVFVLIEVILLSVFNANLMQFALGFLAANFLMFIGSLILIRR